MEVREVEGQDEAFLDYLRRGSATNALALYDLREERDRVRCFAASDDAGAYRGYLLTWRGRAHPNSLLRGSREAARALLPLAPGEDATFLVEPSLVVAVRALHPEAVSVSMDFMTVEGESFVPPTRTKARRLTARDGNDLAALYAEVNLEDDRDYGEWARRGIVYGIAAGGRLVAAAGTHFIAPDLCLVGGVYTAEAFRRQGYGAQAVASVTREALARSAIVGLFVVSRNEAAIRLYEKLGYRRQGRWTWMGVGDVRPPLG